MAEYFEDVKNYLIGLCGDLDLDYVHWVHGGDECVSWCRQCCTYKVRNLKRHDKRHRDEYLVDGGWATVEDGPQFCAGCGEPLECLLTRYGVSSELDHFLSDQFVMEDGKTPWHLEEGPIDPITANELMDVFAGGEQEEEFQGDLLILAGKIRKVMAKEMASAMAGKVRRCRVCGCTDDDENPYILHGEELERACQWAKEGKP